MCGAWAFLSLNFHFQSCSDGRTKHVSNGNAQKIYPRFNCLDSPVLALLSLSRRRCVTQREGPELDYFLEGKWWMNFRYNTCINRIHITWFKLLNQLPLVFFYWRLCTEWELWWLPQHHKQVWVQWHWMPKRISGMDLKKKKRMIAAAYQ